MSAKVKLIKRRKKKKLKKKEIFKLHAKKRFTERTDIHINNDKLSDMKSQINTNAAKYVCKGNKKYRSIWIVKMEGKLFRVVYDTRSHVIVTVHREILEEQENEVSNTESGSSTRCSTESGSA